MSDNDRGRRRFLHTLARLATGGVLAGGVGGLLARSGRGCLREFQCRDCPELSGCGEPQAIMMRGTVRAGMGKRQPAIGDG